MKHSVVLFLGLAVLVVGDDLEANRIISGTNLFSPDVYQKLYTKKETNYLVGTFSSYVDLGMVLSGADAASAFQLQTALRIPHDQPGNELGFKTVLKSFTNASNGLKTSNAIFVSDSYAIRRNYSTTSQNVYGAEATNLDFTDPNQAALYINNWVNAGTTSIKTIIDSKEITPQTKVLLLNALHFKAAWAYPFKSEHTRALPFNVNGGITKSVPTMVYERLYCRYAENKDLEATFLELPFVGGDSSIVFALPDDIDGIDTLEPQIHKVLQQQNFNYGNVKVQIPRFKIEQETDFKAALAQLGVTYVFNPTLADLSKIAGNPGDIHLDRFKQKVSLSLNEEGVDSASAQVASIGIKEPNNVALFAAPLSSLSQFKADHPFLYYIKIKDVITFIGRVRDPSQQIGG